MSQNHGQLVRRTMTEEYAQPNSTTVDHSGDGDGMSWLLNQHPLFYVACCAVIIALAQHFESQPSVPVIINNEAPPPIIINNN